MQETLTLKSSSRIKSEFTNEKGVHRLTGIPLQTLRNGRAGYGPFAELKYHKVGSSVYYRISDVVEFMDERVVSRQLVQR